MSCKLATVIFTLVSHNAPLQVRWKQRAAAETTQRPQWQNYENTSNVTSCRGFSLFYHRYHCTEQTIENIEKPHILKGTLTSASNIFIHVCSTLPTNCHPAPVCLFYLFVLLYCVQNRQLFLDPTKIGRKKKKEEEEQHLTNSHFKCSYIASLVITSVH